MANAVLAELPDRVAERTDHELVSAVRHGDDRAFEELYTRYQRRIAAYVFGMVKDYGRAEDITQEVFVSALRRIRQTERPIAFKPWVYEIAKNACIDAYRRTRRAEEVSFDADDRLSPADHVRLVATDPEPDAAVDTKQDLDHLCGAFGGLSESHHDILVLRELEGLSYKDIGDRMGMSRPAVESTLFRARKRLGEEYDELASGARCQRVQAIIGERGAQLGVRDRRKLARHVSHCQPCRLLAARAGVDVSAPARRRLAGKVAGLLPLPAMLRWRRGGGEEATTALGGGGGGTWMTHAPMLADSMSSGWSKGAAGLTALVLAGAGVGATTLTAPEKRDERGTGYRAIDARPVSDPAGAAKLPRRVAVTPADRPAKAARRADGARRGDRSSSSSDRRAAANARSGDGGKAATGDGGKAASGGQPEAGGASGGGAGGASGGGGGGVDARSTPAQSPTKAARRSDAPKASPVGDSSQAPVAPVEQTIDAVTDAVPDTKSAGPSAAVPEVPVEVPVEVPDPAQVVPNVPAPVSDAVAGLVGP
jgi:RNA polymerase sigma factor (sigma-70 family)